MRPQRWAWCRQLFPTLLLGSVHPAAPTAPSPSSCGTLWHCFLGWAEHEGRGAWELPAWRCSRRHAHPGLLLPRPGLGPSQLSFLLSPWHLPSSWWYPLYSVDRSHNTFLDVNFYYFFVLCNYFCSFETNRERRDTLTFHLNWDFFHTVKTHYSKNVTDEP